MMYLSTEVSTCSTYSTVVAVDGLLFGVFSPYMYFESVTIAPRRPRVWLLTDHPDDYETVG
jgi:hypothetical protein